MRIERKWTTILPIALMTLGLVGTAFFASSSFAAVIRAKSSLAINHLPPPSGNAAAIAFYRKVVAATRKMGGQEESFTGSYSVVDPGTHGWYTGGEAPRTGYVSANDQVWIGVSKERVTFVSDTITPGASASFSPFGLLLNSSGEFLLENGAPASFLSSAPTAYSCEGKTTGEKWVGGFSKVGAPSGYGLFGHFEAMRRAGRNEIVTATYPWNAKQVATEVDTIPIATHLPIVSVTTVSPAVGLAGFSYRLTNRWYAKTPYPPRSTGVCR